MPTKEWLLVSSSMDTIGPRQNSARYGTPMARLFFARRLGQDIALIRKIRHVGRIPAFHVQIASCKRVLFYNTQLFRFTRITIIAGSPCIYIYIVYTHPNYNPLYPCIFDDRIDFLLAMSSCVYQWLNGYGHVPSRAFPKHMSRWCSWGDSPTTKFTTWGPGVVPFIFYMRVITLVTHEVASSIAQRRHHTSPMSNPVFEITIESGATPTRGLGSRLSSGDILFILATVLKC